MSWTERVNRLNQRGYDYDIEHVPQEDRKSTLDLSLVWLGYTIQFATIMVGGMIGLGLPLGAAIMAVLVANVLLAAISITTGLIGRRVGLGFSMLTRYPFGHAGSVIPSILCGIVQLGWLTFCYWIFSNAFQNLFALFNPGLGTLGFFVGIIVTTLLTVVPISFGFQGPRWVAWISMPLIIIPMFYVIVLLLGNAGGLAHVAATYVPPQPISMVKAITLGMGAWLFGATTSPDFVRLGKSDAAAWVAPPVGLIIGESLVLILGVLTAASTAGTTWNPVEAATKLGTGGAVGVIILYMAAMWATNVPTAWSASLQFANAFHRPKTIFAIILGFVAPILAIIIQFSVGALVAIDAFVNLLASVIPPVGGILVAEYWILKGRCLPHILDVRRALNPVAYLAWIIAGGVDRWTNVLATQAGSGVGFGYGIPGLNGFLLAIVVYAVLMAIANASGAAWTRYAPEAGRRQGAGAR